MCVQRLKVHPRERGTLSRACYFFKNMHHNNVSFTDEKAFILNDLLKQLIHRDPLTGNILQMLISSEVNTHKRCDIVRSIRLFWTTKSVKTLRCAISEENVTTGMFQRCKNFLAHTGFLVSGEMTVCDDATMHAKGEMLI